MGRGAVARRAEALSPLQGAYAVLAAVSRGYPPPAGRYPTRYSPVRRSQPPEGGARTTCMRYARRQRSS